MLAAEGIDDGELGIAFVGPDESRALKREHLGHRRGHRRALVPDRRPRRAAGRRAAPARRRRPLPAGRRRRLARAARARRCCTCSATTTAPEMEAREEALAPELRRRRCATGCASRPQRRRLAAPRHRPRAPADLDRRELQLRLRGDHPRPPHAAEHADPLRGAAASCWSLALVVGVDRLELIALLLAIAFVLIAEMINTAIEAAIDVATTLVRPAREAREGHRGRRRADRRRSTRSRSATSSSPGTSATSTTTARPAPRRAGEADADRAGPDRHPRDRDEGADRPRHAAARRPALRPRGDRVRRAGWRSR